ncbi:MAG: zinc ribbon domain-containing protein [Spirochaetaceae bacterium]|nr:zinc ribbon domain-containing protein [Spirochaetaceae bacterium]
MAFCQNCGNQLAADAKFCSNCGTPAGSTGTENVRKQEYVGSVKKCPNCGAEIPSLSAVCTNCGHELNSSSTNKLMKEFQEGLIAYEGEQERDFVAAFPIPNTREDLGNFLSLIASVLLTDLKNGADSKRIASFTSKFEDIANKIEIVLPSEDLLQTQIIKWREKITEAKNIYNEILKKRREANKKINKEKKRENSFARRHPIMFWVMLLGIMMGVSFLVLCWSIEIDATKKDEKIAELMKNIKPTGIPKENIILPAHASSYCEIISDPIIGVIDSDSVYVQFYVKCTKEIKPELDKKLADLRLDYSIYEKPTTISSYYCWEPLESAKVNEEVLIQKEYNLDWEFELFETVIDTQIINLASEKFMFYYFLRCTKKGEELGYTSKDVYLK